MKNLTLVFTFLLSMNSFAGIDSVKNILSQKEVIALETTLAKEGFILSSITDNYAQDAVAPRCICDSFKISFNKFVKGVKKTTSYSVEVDGYADSQSVQVNKIVK